MLEKKRILFKCVKHQAGRNSPCHTVVKTVRHRTKKVLDAARWKDRIKRITTDFSIEALKWLRRVHSNSLKYIAANSA